MTQYREILRLHSQGISNRNIALGCECSRNTVSKVLERAATREVLWPLEAELTDAELEKQFFPRDSSSMRTPPDLEYLHKELTKQGVALRLLWTEYCEACRD